MSSSTRTHHANGSSTFTPVFLRSRVFRVTTQLLRRGIRRRRTYYRVAAGDPSRGCGAGAREQWQPNRHSRSTRVHSCWFGLSPGRRTSASPPAQSGGRHLATDSTARHEDCLAECRGRLLKTRQLCRPTASTRSVPPTCSCASLRSVPCRRCRARPCRFRTRRSGRHCAPRERA